VLIHVLAERFPRRFIWEKGCVRQMEELCGDAGLTDSFTADRGEQCDIFLSPGEFCFPGDRLRARLAGYPRFHVLLDAAVGRQWPELRDFLQAIPHLNVLTMRGGERCKTVGGLERVMSWLDGSRAARRSEPLVIIGGGAILDVGSLAASLYRRGIPFWRVPSTLIAMTDAGLGLKTAINFKGRKNLVGTFTLPERVIVDTNFLSTLGRRHIISGIAETIKLGLGVDATLFTRIEKHHSEYIRSRFQRDGPARFVHDAMATMLSQLKLDPYETSPPRVTDLGHSLSRVFEQVLHPRPLHGEAVALDMALMATYSRAVGLSTKGDWVRIVGLLRDVGLPVSYPGLSQEFIGFAFEDILRHRDGDRNFPQPVRPGRVVMAEIDPVAMASLGDLHATFVKDMA
jgi:2-epi-5-epi-valiolone synthase